jgi:diguanylate cyclase (GGDEF)-like protein
VENKNKNNRLLVALVILLVFAFLATSLISYYSASSTVRNNIIEQQLPLTADNIYSEIQRDIIGPVNVSAQMANDAFLRHWILDGERNPKKITQYLSEVKEKFSADTAFLVAEHSRNYWSENGFLKKVTQKDPLDVWYFRVRDMPIPFEVNIDVDEANRNRLTIFVNYRIKDFTNQYIGATGVGISFKNLTELIDLYQSKFHRTVFFLDAKGNVVLSGTNYPFEEVSKNIQLVQHQILSASTVPTKLTYHHKNATYQLNSRYIPELKWYLVVQEDEAQAVAPLKRILMTNLLICLVATLLVVAITLFLMRGYQERIEHMAHTDKLSGLPNREMGEIQWDIAIHNARRFGEELSIVIVDIDHFKKINDQYGHLAGDQVIREFSSLLKVHTRGGDIVSRWGGEEFFVTLVGTSLDEAVEWSERLRAALLNHQFHINEKTLQVTASFGVAQMHENQTRELLFKRADEALYQAKIQGRNQVVKSTI